MNKIYICLIYIMKKNIKLPFTDKITKGGKSFKILKNDDITDIIKKMFKNNSANKIIYVKASNSKDYYKQLSN